MHTTLGYTISSFNEQDISISGIRCVMNTQKKSIWKTKSCHAVLEINFEAANAFEIKICIRHLGLLAPLILKISTEFGEAYNMHHIFNCKEKVFSIPSKELKISIPEIEMHYLKFEFTKIGEFIEVGFIILQTLKSNLTTIKTSENSSKTKSYKQKLQEKSKAQADKNFTFESPLEILPPLVKESMIKQQERLKSYIPDEARIKEGKYNTRSNSQEQKLSQSYSGLLKGKVVFVNIEETDLKKVVYELLDVMGSVYIDSFSDACNLVISENVTGVWDVREVGYKWLFECVEQRKLCPYDLLYNYSVFDL